mgnify:CR=1 FL=1
MKPNEDNIMIEEVMIEIIKKSVASLQQLDTAEKYLKYAPAVADMCAKYLNCAH